MDPVTMGLLAGAGVGLLKGGVLDKNKEKRQRKQEAEIARYSPWTGMQAQRVQEADPLGSAMQGAMGGAMLGQGLGGMGGGGAAAAAPAGGAAATSDPGVAASLTGGQSQMGQTAPGVDPAMAQKYPWLAMR